MAVDHDVKLMFSNDLLAQVSEMIKSYLDESIYYEMSFLLPAWKYLDKLVLNIQKALDSHIQMDGCIVHMDGLADDPALNWSKNSAELQALLTKIEVDITRRKNPGISRSEAAVMVALQPILVLK